MPEGPIRQETPFTYDVKDLAKSFSMETMNARLNPNRAKQFVEEAAKLIDEWDASEDAQLLFGPGDLIDQILHAFDECKDFTEDQPDITAGITDAIRHDHPILEDLSEPDDMRYLMDMALQNEIVFWEQEEWLSDALKFWYPYLDENYRGHPSEMLQQRLETLKRYQQQLRERVSPTQSPERGGAEVHFK